MATNASQLQATVNAAIAAALQADPDTNGLVYVSYDNPDLGIQEADLPVHA
jgi:hypothetical protein